MSAFWATNALGANVPCPVLTGEYASAAVNGTTLTTLATTAARFLAYPFISARTITVNQIGTYVTTGVASAKMRLGVYADTGARYPGALLADSGELDAGTSSTAAEGTISLTLERGVLYWLAQIGNSNPTIRAFQNAGVMPLRSPDGSGTSIDNILFVASSYGALPATAPGSLAAAASSSPYIRLRVA